MSLRLVPPRPMTEDERMLAFDRLLISRGYMPGLPSFMMRFRWYRRLIATIGRALL